jgi:CMP-N,N'-diacetyllegionaminic acid synthase
MKILGIIPARGGSKGVPDKNIKPLAGKPLIAYTIHAANQSKLDRVIVSTDSNKIAEVAQQYEVDVPFLRPAELGTDNAKAIPVIQHALQFLSKKGEEYDAVMMLQPTTPFRRTEDINEAIDILKRTGADSVISVVNVEGHHPARMKYLGDDGRLIDPPFCEAYENQPRQELEPMYLRNGAIYLTRKEILLQNSFKGKDCRAQIMAQEYSVNIDTEFDFAYATWIYHQFFK